MKIGHDKRFVTTVGASLYGVAVCTYAFLRLQSINPANLGFTESNDHSCRPPLPGPHDAGIEYGVLAADIAADNMAAHIAAASSNI